MACIRPARGCRGVRKCLRAGMPAESLGNGGSPTSLTAAVEYARYVCEMPAPVREHLAAPPGLLLTPALYYAHPTATRWAVFADGIPYPAQHRTASWRVANKMFDLCIYGVLTTHMRLKKI
jgi:hypothetical protein